MNIHNIYHNRGKNQFFAFRNSMKNTKYNFGDPTHEDHKCLWHFIITYVAHFIENTVKIRQGKYYLLLNYFEQTASKVLNFKNEKWNPLHCCQGNLVNITFTRFLQAHTSLKMGFL